MINHEGIFSVSYVAPSDYCFDLSLEFGFILSYSSYKRETT